MNVEGINFVENIFDRFITINAGGCSCTIIIPDRNTTAVAEQLKVKL